MIDITALRARVQHATGPDRELDALIAVATTPTKRTEDDLIYVKPVHRDDECAPGTYWLCQRSGMSLRTAPEYTASVEEVGALINDRLPGWTWETDSFPADEVFNPGGVQAFVAENMSNLHSGYGHGEHKTEPLALILALLTALAPAPEAA